MIVINGKVYEGNNISIIGDNVSIDGVVVQGSIPKEGSLMIEIKGTPVSVSSTKAITIHGDVHGNVDAGGDIKCGHVMGDVDAGGDVQCLKVSGSIDAGGDVSVSNLDR